MKSSHSIKIAKVAYFQTILILGILLFITTTAKAQNVLKFKTTDFAYTMTNSSGEWMEWSEWQDAKILITMDFDTERIKIFSKETQIYDIATDEGKTSNENGDDIYSFFCVNEDGLQCRLKLWKRHFESGELYHQLYIHFRDTQYVYNINLLD